MQIVQGSKQMEGAGVQICRTVGTPNLRNLDPYLMLDELKLPAKQAFAGFPDHPHRGFETCSIMLDGQYHTLDLAGVCYKECSWCIVFAAGIMEHKDSAGNHGIITNGGVQWMTAGRGVFGGWAWIDGWSRCCVCVWCEKSGNKKQVFLPGYKQVWL